MIHRKFYQSIRLFLKVLIVVFSLSVDCIQERSGFTLKILMVVPSFPKISDVHMLNQITGLIDLGLDVYIYTKRKNQFSKIQEDVKKYDLENRTFYKELPPNLDEFDIVIFQLGHRAFDVKKEWNFKGKLAICFRGYDMSGYIKENPKVYDTIFPICDLFLPVCKLFEERIISLGGDPKNIAVIHSAIDCTRFKFKKRYAPQPHQKINIISAGRFVEKKGFEYAIRAVARLVKKHPNIRYTIIGGGPLAKRLKGLIKKLKVSKYVRILGWQTHDELVKILDKSHLFVAPSVTAKNGDLEGIPNVLKEAMAMGLLVISTYHAGIPELVEHGQSGLLVHERDYVALAKQIHYLMTHQKIWPLMGKFARKKVEEQFNKDQENKRLATVLKELFCL